MIKTFAFVLFLFCLQAIEAQSLSNKLTVAIKTLEQDTQMKSALISFYVIDRKDGREKFAHNADVGLPLQVVKK